MLHSSRSFKIGSVGGLNLSKLQAVALLALVAYAGALIASPGYQVMEAGTVLRRTVAVIPGWRFALLGWLAPP